MITKGHANECIMINERHNAYDELQGIGAYTFVLGRIAE